MLLGANSGGRTGTNRSSEAKGGGRVLACGLCVDAPPSSPQVDGRFNELSRPAPSRKITCNIFDQVDLIMHAWHAAVLDSVLAIGVSPFHLRICKRPAQEPSSVGNAYSRRNCFSRSNRLAC
jgi:hypothetical protein